MILEKARYMPVITLTKAQLQSLEIRGKANLFKYCPLETQLREYVPGAQTAESGDISEVMRSTRPIPKPDSTIIYSRRHQL